MADNPTTETDTKPGGKKAKDHKVLLWLGGIGGLLTIYLIYRAQSSSSSSGSTTSSTGSPSSVALPSTYSTGGGGGGTQQAILGELSNISTQLGALNAKPTPGGSSGSTSPTSTKQQKTAAKSHTTTYPGWPEIPAGSKTPITVPKTTNKPAPNTYTVQPGNTLWGIAGAKMGNPQDWQELYKANHAVIGNNPNLIRAGEKLKIP